MGQALVIAAFVVFAGAFISMTVRQTRVMTAACSRAEIFAAAKRLVPEDAAMVISVVLSVVGALLWRADLALGGAWAGLLGVIWLGLRLVRPYSDAWIWGRVINRAK